MGCHAMPSLKGCERDKIPLSTLSPRSNSVTALLHCARPLPLDIHADVAHAFVIIGENPKALMTERQIALPPASEGAQRVDHSIQRIVGCCGLPQCGGRDYAARSLFPRFNWGV
jgi:hypothetical protein